MTISNSDNNINTIADNMGDALKALRGKAVTFENGATAAARSIFAALLTGAATADKVIATTIAAFGNPMTPGGKPLTTLSSSSGDHIVGWGSTRKAVTSMLKTFENAKGDEQLTAMVRGFVLSEKDAPKSLQGLEKAVKAAMREAAAKEMGTDGDTAETDGSENATAPSLDFNKVALYIAGLSVEQVGQLADGLTAVRDAIAGRFDAYAEAKLAKAA